MPSLPMETAALEESPADFQAHQSFSLSPFDQHAPPVYTRWLLCFPLADSSQRTNVCTGLKEGLHHMLLRYPHLYGHVGPALCLSNAGAERIEVRHAPVCSNLDESNRFSIKVIESIDYRNLQEMGMPADKLTPETFTKLRSEPDMDRHPQVLHVQVNVINGGIILAVYIHHSVMDGCSMSKFIDEYAKHVKPKLDSLVSGKALPLHPLTSPPQPGLEPLACLPLFAQGSMHDLNVEKALQACPERKMAIRSHENEKPRDLPTRPRATGRTFIFSSNKMALLKESLSRHLASQSHAATEEEKSSFISTLDCISALVWIYNIRARSRHLQKDGASRFLVAIDVRNRLQPPIPESYMGNATLYNTAELPIKVLLEGDQPSVSLLARVASTIRRTINSVTHDFVKQRIQLLSLANFGTLDINMNASGHGPDMYITSWAKMCIDADFGGLLGRPQYVRKPWEPNEGANIVLPRCWERASVGARESQAWEVFVQTAEEDMETLLGPDGLEKWAERVV